MCFKTDCLSWIKEASFEGDAIVLFFDPPYENQKLYEDFLGEAKKKLQDFRDRGLFWSSNFAGKRPLAKNRSKNGPENLTNLIGKALVFSTFMISHKSFILDSKELV